MAADRLRLASREQEVGVQEIYFWMDILSLHQAAHIRALSAREGVEVTLVAERETDPWRQAGGWHVPAFGTARIVLGPNAEAIDRLMRGASSGAVHVFSGIRANRMVEAALRRGLETPARLGLMTEAADPRGWKGLARLVRWRSDLSRFGGRLAFVLAMGQTAIDWYRRCGFPAAKLFPYGYFVEPPGPASLDPEPGTGAGAVNLMYLGQCVPRKGVDLLLRALSPLSGLNWTLEIMGDGPAEGRWRALARRLGIAGRVAFLPARPNPIALDELRRKDLLILPSRHDGWGAVVNESLMRGVPVICSDRCGAGDLLRSSWRGETYPAGSVADLRTVLVRWIGQGKRTPELADRIRSWSGRIGGDAAADYFLAVQRYLSRAGARPTPPWHD